MAPKKNNDPANCQQLADNTGPNSEPAKQILAACTIRRLPTRATTIPVSGIDIIDPAALHNNKTPNNPADKWKFACAEGIREIQVEKISP